MFKIPENILAVFFQSINRNGRYKHYYKAQGTMRSDEILERILDNFLILLKRMEWQFPFFEIESYPNEIDSYTHVKLKNCGMTNNKNNTLISGILFLKNSLIKSIFMI